MRRHLTADERYVQRVLGDPIKTIERALQVTRREICFDQLADQLEREYPSCQWRGFFVPMASPAMLQTTGAVGTQTILIARGSTSFFMTATGTSTLTFSKTVSANLTAIAAGGGGTSINSAGNGNGGGGAGAGASTLGMVITLLARKVYTVVVPPAVSSDANGAACSLVNTTDSTTIMSVDGGKTGSDFSHGSGGLASSSTGSNLHNGVNGADGGLEVSGGGSAGSSDGSAAGGGGCGRTGDGAGAGFSGGAGKDEAGQAPTTDESSNGAARGGRGGGWSFNGTLCGAGGGGGSGAVFGTGFGSAGLQGAAKLAF
jgi:hypothetical protein